MFFQKNILSDCILIRYIHVGPYVNYTYSCAVHYTTAHVPWGIPQVDWICRSIQSAVSFPNHLTHFPVEIQSLKHSSVWIWSRCWKMMWEVNTVICVSRPLPRPSAKFLGHSFTSKPKGNKSLLVLRYPNGYSQYFNTQWLIVYYTWFTVSTLTGKSVFWYTHGIHVFLIIPFINPIHYTNTQMTDKFRGKKNSLTVICV